MPDLFAVAICTRNRPGHLARTLDALDAQTDRDFHILVIDQSDERDEELARRAAADERLDVLEDEGRGLSRARNLAWRRLDAEWVVYVDDDCLAEREWAEELRAVLAGDPPVELVTCHIGGENAGPDEDYLPVTTLPLTEEQLVKSRWTRPWRIGFGVCMAVRRSAAERLGGWDERLGPGVPEFPASDDMDFNWRLTRSGGAVLLTPGPRVLHDQWRTVEDLLPLYNGYSRAWGGFAIKTLKKGDLVGGLWMWGARFKGILKLAWAGINRRSRLRLVVAWLELRGLLTGTAKALTRSW